MDHEYSKSDGGNWCALCGLPESDSNHFDPVDLGAVVEAVDLGAVVEELRTANMIAFLAVAAEHPGIGQHVAQHKLRADIQTRLQVAEPYVPISERRGH